MPNGNQPNVLVNQQIPQKREGFKWTVIFRPKVIFLVLAAILIVEAFFAIRSLQKPLPPVPKPPLPITGASFELLDFVDQSRVGEKILVQVRLSTGGNPVGAADFILRFDPKVLSLAKNDIATGKIFSSYPLVEVDEKGLVRVSGTTSDESFIGIGIMAELQLTAKSAGKTSLSLEFNQNDTKDSNVVDSSGKDILEKVQNLNLEIR